MTVADILEKVAQPVVPTKQRSRSEGGGKRGENAAGGTVPTKIGALKELPSGFTARFENGVVTYFDNPVSDPAAAPFA
jgi:hypothetical protein